MTTWASLAEYYAADPRRSGPREVELGGWWFDRPDEAPWRAVWNSGTGELCLVRVAEDHVGPVEVLATFGSRGEVDVALRGWWQVMGQPGGLGWLRRRLRTAATG